MGTIVAEDYFLKSTEFRAWLHEEKDRVRIARLLREIRIRN